MQIIVHDMMADGLVVAHDVFVDLHHVDVLGELVFVGLVGKLVDEERVHVIVAFSVGVGELASWK